MVTKGNKPEQVYAVYKGDTFFFDGTAKEIASCFGIKVSTVRKMASPSYQDRTRNGMNIVKLGKDDENQ